MKTLTLTPALMIALLTSISSTSQAKNLNESDVQTVKEQVQQFSKNNAAFSVTDKKTYARRSPKQFGSITDQIHGEIKFTIVL